MKDDVIGIEVYIKAVENHYQINGEVTKKYHIGAILNGEEFEKLLTEKEYDAGKFGTALFGEKLVLNYGCNLKHGEMAELIAKCTKEYETHHVFHFLGYVIFNDEIIYITSNGAINKDGPIKNCSVVIPGIYSCNPEYLKLPETEAEIKELIKQSLSLLLTAEGKPRFIGLITVPIATRSLLTHILPIKCIFFFIGDSGYLKSTGAAVQQSFSFPGIAENSLPLNFASTTNGIRLYCSFANNSVVVIDDYNTARVDEALSEFLTLETSRTTPRLTAISGSELGQPVKTNTTVIVTGEHSLNTDKDSRDARVIYIEFLPNSIPINKLSQIQEFAAEGVYFKVMILFIQWILANHERLEVEVKEKYEHFREKAAKELPAGTHPRLCENTADFFIGLYFFIEFCIEKKYLAEKERNKYLDPYWERIKRIISRQQKIIADYEPQGVFARFIKKALSDGRLHLKSQNDIYIDHFRSIKKGEKPAGDFLGYLKDESGDIYVPTTIDPHAVLHVLPKRLRSLIPPSQKSFWKKLDEFGLYIPMESGNKNRLKIAGHSKPVDCYLLHLSELFD